MPKVREVLSHVQVEQAERERMCHRNREHSIVKGEVCLAVYEGPRRKRKNYCRACARDILACAEDRLRSVTNQLYSSQA
jgi:polyferredoxin